MSHEQLLTRSLLALVTCCKFLPVCFSARVNSGPCSDLYHSMVAVMTMNVGYFLSVLGGIFLGSLSFGRYATLY